ncbi:homoserine kinase [Salaquimonas pukyongi]|uniref:homoserine kinase n=1 Tax=Salaquimonas pukyongi TaxID=2712698 RepID=UPI00096B92E1|nr:homoserine kinase [Salaquimonas pukyongi]
MAVYTEVSDEQITAHLTLYDIGELHALKGIAGGVENSNYLLTTDAGNFILTLYEKRVEAADLPFFLGLMEHLSQRGINCPLPIRMKNGEALGELAGRPAAIISYLDGFEVRRPQPSHCRQVGEALAQMHLAGNGFSLTRRNGLTLEDWRPLFEKSKARADEVRPGLAAMIAAELDFLEGAWRRDLPEGVIHADLFTDNVFFLKGELSGIIDFYFACNDLLAYDLATCLNAWCFESNHQFNTTKARALIRGYRSVRPLEAGETEALPMLCRGSALRFLLTRLYDWLNVPPGALVTPKDPAEYITKLKFHQGIDSAALYGLEEA